jgi:hypothetical protein
MGTSALFNVNTAMKAMIATNAIEMTAIDALFALMSGFLASAFSEFFTIYLYRLTVPQLRRRFIISYKITAPMRLCTVKS